MTTTFTRSLSVCLLAALVSADVARAASDSQAASLMQRKLYPQAIEALQEEMRGMPESAAGLQQLRMGECYYTLGKYTEARPWYAKAQKNLPKDKNSIVAEYRLACVAFRVNDVAAAMKATQAFIKSYPEDRRGGSLLVLQMKALAGQGRKAGAELEATRKLLQAGQANYEAKANMAADKILTDFYLENGDQEKAIDGYMSIVNNFRKVSAEYASTRRAVPPELEQARDYAAMQLAGIEINAKRHAEAIKWLDSIRFDQDMMRRARLLLAQIAYEKRDYDKAKSYLLDNNYVESVPPGEVRAEMYLLLGYCAKMDSQPTMEKVLGLFGKVDPGTEAFAQARMGMGDTAMKWRHPEIAVTHFEEACVSTKYEPEARSRLGTAYMDLAEKAGEPAKKTALYRKAAEHFGLLTTKYPSTHFAKGASEPIKKLIAMGLDVKLAVSDEEVILQWEKTVGRNPGSPESARALINIARTHQKAMLEEKTDKYIKAPDYEACLNACDRLLDPAVYTGKGLAAEFWRDIQTEALYYRGLCRVSSIGQKLSETNSPAAGSAPNPAVPRYVKNPEPAKAMADLQRAQEMVDPKQQELAKNIEIVLLEAMLKSDDAQKRAAAEKRFNELVEQYGREPRFQKLAVDLAAWHHEQGNYLIAARMYRGVADRGRSDLSQENITRLLFTAGKLYSKAAYDSLNKKTERLYGIYIYPRDVVTLTGLINSHKPFQMPIRADWPATEITGGQALGIVSQLSGIPFVWSGEPGPGSTADYLNTKRVRFENKDGTVKEFLEQILDLDKYELAFDIGLTGATPTIKPDDAEDASLEEKAIRRIIEIHAGKDKLTRYAPMTRPYGVWAREHKGATMMFTVMKRIQELSGAKIEYAEGLNREDVLAAEYAAPPGLDVNADHSCAEVLAALLEAQGLNCRVVQRNLSDELYEQAKDCFNEVRKIDPKGPECEQSLFLLALNYYQQENYERMKIVLQSYLKTFDSSAYAHYHEACFWVGWTLEQDKRYRDAWRYYNRAAEEALIICKPADDAELPPPDELKTLLSHDSIFALQETVTGSFTNFTLENTFPEFVRVNTGMEIRMDPSTTGVTTNRFYRTFKDKPVFDLIYSVLRQHHLTFRAENVDKTTAEKAYYRMAQCYRQEGLNDQALASCVCLLDRYPKTTRRRATIKLQLDIYKALKNYGKVLETLMLLKTELGDEAFKIDFEIAWVYIDLCRYDDAVRHFKTALDASTDPLEGVKIRDGYARALWKSGQNKEALEQYRTLMSEEPGPLRKFIDEMLVWYLERATGEKTDDSLPGEASQIIREYEALDADGTAHLTPAELAKVTWIYYIAGLVDLMRNDPDRALEKFNAAANSPDDSLAADSIYDAGMLHMAAKRFEAAQDSFEYLLFSTKSAEAEVKAMYHLGLCRRALGDTVKAEERFNKLLTKFPDSSYAGLVRDERKKKAEEEAMAAAEAERMWKVEEAAKAEAIRKKQAEKEAKLAAEAEMKRKMIEAAKAEAEKLEP